MLLIVSFLFCFVSINTHTYTHTTPFWNVLFLRVANLYEHTHKYLYTVYIMYMGLKKTE